VKTVDIYEPGDKISLYSCPRCGRNVYNEVTGVDCYGANDITTYIKCLGCNLLYWFSSFTGRTNTNGNDAA